MFIRTPIYSSRTHTKEVEIQDLVDKIVAAEVDRDPAAPSFSAGERGHERVAERKKEVNDKITSYLESKAASEKVARDKERDGYLVKILKYVPIELSSVFAGLVALAVATNQVDSRTNEVESFWSPFDLDITPVKGIFLLGVVLTPLYFYLGARKIEKIEDRPTWWFYLLSPLAFTIWAMAINNDTRRALDRGEHTTELFLALGALLIPAVDEFCLLIFGEKKPARQADEGVGGNTTGSTNRTGTGRFDLQNKLKRSKPAERVVEEAKEVATQQKGSHAADRLAGATSNGHN